MKITKGNFKGTVVNEGDNWRVLKMTDQDLWDKFLLNFEIDDVLSVEVVPWREGRSKKQNNYYWGVVVKMISEHTGFEIDETHEVLRRKFLTYSKEYKGKKYLFFKSTADMTTKEFCDYVDRVVRFASKDLGVAIPDPDSDTSWY